MTASKTTATGSGGTTWTITFTDTVTFANANAATYFWNCGGLVKIQFSKTSTGTDSDADWNTFVNSTCANAVYISADSTVKTIGALASVGGTFKTGGTGTPTTILANTGWNQLTSTPVTVYKQFDTVYTYTGDYVQVNASANTTALVLTTTWVSAARTAPGESRNISGGTATTGITFGSAPTTVVTTLSPETTYLSNVWGTTTIVSSVA